MDLVTSFLRTLIKGTAPVLVIELIIISVILSRPLGLIVHTVVGGHQPTGSHFKTVPVARTHLSTLVMQPSNDN